MKSLLVGSQGLTQTGLLLLGKHISDAKRCKTFIFDHTGVKVTFAIVRNIKNHTHSEISLTLEPL